MTQLLDKEFYQIGRSEKQNILLVPNRQNTIVSTLTSLGLKSENFGLIPNKSTMKSDECHKCIDPTTNQAIAKIYYPSWKQIDHSLTTMIDKQKIWSKIPAKKRIAILSEINNLFKSKQNDYAKLLAIEIGKTFDEALGEEVEVHNTMTLILKQAHCVDQYITYPSEEVERQKQGCERYQLRKPLGIVQKTTAFNFPRAVFLWGAFPALAAGNGVHLKPHPGAALASLATVKHMNQIFKKYDLEGLVTISVTNIENGQKLWLDERIKMIEATGSEKMGRAVLQTVSKRKINSFIRTNLELGGNNASVIRHDANLDIAVNLLVFSCVGLQGQRCTTTSRIFVHKSKFKEFLKSFKEAYKKKIRIGDPLSKGINFGPLFHKQGLEIYKKTLRELPKDEAEIICGGHVIADNFVEPTIVKVNSTKFPFSYHEYFAPIVFVMPFEDDTNVIEEVNKPGFGLSGSVFTKDKKMFNQYAENIRATVFNHNYGTSGAEVVGVFGGWDKTGNGQMLGSYPEGKLFEHYTNPTGGLIAPSDIQTKHAQGVTFD